MLLVLFTFAFLGSEKHEGGEHARRDAGCYSEGQDFYADGWN